MQFVGIGKLIDIVCENKNYINFVTEADERENKPNLLL